CFRYPICSSSSELYRHSLSFSFKDTATSELYTLSLHDALPILTVATSVVAAAVILSKPSFRNSGSNAGRNINEDSMFPVTETKIANGIITVGMIRSPLFENVLDR